MFPEQESPFAELCIWTKDLIFSFEQNYYDRGYNFLPR